MYWLPIQQSNQSVKNLSIALLLVASTAAAQRLVPDPAFARLPGPTLRIADSLKIDVQKLKIEPPLYPFAGPKNSLILYAQWRSVWAFDSTGKRLWSKSHSWNDNDKTDRRDRSEIGEVTAIGWDANGIWVSDAAWGQVALLDQYGNSTKSLELPDWVRPSFSNRKTFPVFEGLRVFARYPDGSMLVIPRGAMSITGATSYDQDATYLLRINEDGIIQRTIAKIPSNVFRRKEGDREFTFQNPLNQNAIKVSPDGMRVMVLSVDTSAAKTDTIVIRALNEKGDTAWTQKVAYPALVYSDTQVDSIARSRWGNDTEYRERRVKYMPRRAQAVVEFVLDADKSAWFTLRGNGSTRPVVGIDAAGKPIGKFLLPNRRVVRAANNGGLWIAEYRADSRGDLVRYRLK
jgi:hypothetical protein